MEKADLPIQRKKQLQQQLQSLKRKKVKNIPHFFVVPAISNVQQEQWLINQLPVLNIFILDLKGKSDVLESQNRKVKTI